MLMFQSPRKIQWASSARIIVVLLVWAASTVPVVADEWKMHRQSASHMGTTWQIALYSRDAQAANAGFTAAWQIIGEIDRDLTNYSADSELNRLCRTSPHTAPVKVGEHLWNVLAHADQLSRKTSGAFDVTIGPASKLWRRARATKRMPDETELATARKSIGFQHIELDPEAKTVRLLKPNMQIDLGGIAKGYAVDRAIAVLRLAGIDSALVNGGGDLAVSSPPPLRSGWQIDLAGLNPKEKPMSIQLAHAAVATSGDAWQFLEIGGKRYSHIIDPRTAVGTTRRISATVIAPNCMTADSLASALCILEPSKGMQLVEASEAVEARIILAHDEHPPQTHYSAGFPGK